MGPRGQDMGRLVLIALAAIVVGLTLPAYSKGVAAFRMARSAEPSWLGHVGIFATMLVLVLAALALVPATLVAAGWVIERVGRRIRPKF